MEWFENWFDSEYYHLLYQNRSEEEAIHFVSKCVQILETKPNETLLDLACGKGRHSVAFANCHLDVTGVDLSKESIARAKLNEKDNLHFYVHDMRNVFRTNYFDYVCNLFTSFGYFRNDHDNLLAAKSIFLSLKPKGTLLIDFVNRNYAIRSINSNLRETILLENIEFNIQRSFTDKKFIKDIHIKNGMQHFHFQESVNSFTLTEMTALFHSVGLSLKATFGNYELAAYNEVDSPRMILKFEKIID